MSTFRKIQIPDDLVMYWLAHNWLTLFLTPFNASPTQICISGFTKYKVWLFYHMGTLNIFILSSRKMYLQAHSLSIINRIKITDKIIGFEPCGF